MNKILSTEEFLDFECSCGKMRASQDDLINICNDPFSGIILSCDECGEEYDISINFLIMKT